MDTVPGGLYLNPDGKSYHDANGLKIEKEDGDQRIADFKAEQQARGVMTNEEKLQRDEDALALAENKRRGTGVVQPASGAGSNAPLVKPKTGKGGAAPSGTTAPAANTVGDGATSATGASAGASSESGGTGGVGQTDTKP